MSKENDFEDRCVALNHKFCKAGKDEISSKVWIAVLSEMMKAICKAQKEPKKAFQEIIDNLIMNFDKEEKC